MDNGTAVLPNGAAAAALIASSVGAFSLGVCALLGDASTSVAHALTFWNPTGPLSGVTSVAIAVWLVTWLALSHRWANRQINLARISWAAAVLFIIGLLLTFPPFMDLLQGK